MLPIFAESKKLGKHLPISNSGTVSLSPKRFSKMSNDRMTELKNRSKRSMLDVLHEDEPPVRTKSKIQTISEMKSKSPSNVIHGYNVT